MALWGKTDALVSVPKWLETDAANRNVSNDADNAVFVDVTEASIAANRAKGLKTPGWNLYSNAGGRHRTEVLVAMKVSASDAGDDGISSNTTIEDTIVADSEVGGGGTTTVEFLATTDYGNWQYASTRIDIGSPLGSLATLLNNGDIGIGAVITTSGGMVGTTNVTLTSAFVFNPIAGGGTGAWQADFTVNSGASSPTGSASSVTVTY